MEVTTLLEADIGEVIVLEEPARRAELLTRVVLPAAVVRLIVMEIGEVLDTWSEYLGGLARIAVGRMRMRFTTETKSNDRILGGINY